MRTSVMKRLKMRRNPFDFIFIYRIRLTCRIRATCHSIVRAYVFMYVLYVCMDSDATYTSNYQPRVLDSILTFMPRGK